MLHLDHGPSGEPTSARRWELAGFTIASRIVVAVMRRRELDLLSECRTFPSMRLQRDRHALPDQLRVCRRSAGRRFGPRVRSSEFHEDVTHVHEGGAVVDVAHGCQCRI
jgi:hypothetical protein